MAISNITKASKDDLLALLKSNPPDASRKYTFRAKITLALRDNEIEKLIAELDSSNLTLATFIDDRMKIEALDQRAAIRSRPRELASMCKRIRDHAEDLYTALAQARTANCQSAHRVLLHLENKFPPETSPYQRTPVLHKVHFSLAFALEGVSTDSVCWHEGTVSINQQRSKDKDVVQDICHLVEAASLKQHAFELHLWRKELTWGKSPEELAARQVVSRLHLMTTLISRANDPSNPPNRQLMFPLCSKYSFLASSTAFATCFEPFSHAGNVIKCLHIAQITSLLCRTVSSPSTLGHSFRPSVVIPAYNREPLYHVLIS